MRRMFGFVRISIVELIRLPSFLLPLAIFPTLLYVTIGLRQSGDRSLIMLGYCAFAILGTMMFQFGVGVATSRNEPWSIYVQTLPGRASERLAAMLISGVAFSAAFCLPVIVTGLASSHTTLTLSPNVVLVAFALIFGAVSLGLLGLALGYWLPARGAVAIANLVYFPLSFAGGLFGPVNDGMLATIHPWIPTGAWMDLLYAATFSVIAPVPLTILSLYAVLFGVAATLGYRRVERTVFA